MLFSSGVADAALSETFTQVRDAPQYAPARMLMERIFSEWPRGKRAFVRDFQRHGFSARVWELSLFAYLTERDYRTEVGDGAPDFLVESDGVEVAIEATTSNPPEDVRKLAPDVARERPFPPQPDGLDEARAEFLVQLAKALRGKMLNVNGDGQHYWERPRIAGRPLVFAVEAFHANEALWFGDSSLAEYLYGFSWTGRHDSSGQAVVKPVRILEHRFRNRTIPSGFFGFPDSEHVSAVLFSNAATTAQFQRIAVEVGLGSPGITVIRTGSCYDPDPNALEPASFSYKVERGKYRETFATGLRLFHNPNAIHPVPRGFLTDLSEMYLTEENLVAGNHPEFVPFSSVTLIFRGGSEEGGTGLPPIT